MSGGARILSSAAALLLVSAAGCAPSSQRLERLARAGEIQDDAPIKANVSVLISAPQARVWALLTDIDHWPRWQPAIRTATLNGPLAPGITFKWSSGG